MLACPTYQLVLAIGRRVLLELSSADYVNTGALRKRQRLWLLTQFLIEKLKVETHILDLSPHVLSNSRIVMKLRGRVNWLMMMVLAPKNWLVFALRKS